MSLVLVLLTQLAQVRNTDRRATVEKSSKTIQSSVNEETDAIASSDERSASDMRKILQTTESPNIHPVFHLDDCIFVGWSLSLCNFPITNTKSFSFLLVVNDGSEEGIIYYQTSLVILLFDQIVREQ
jgi:hypothetical protein